MSKSLGNVLDPFEVMDTFGTDALRYYCFREVSFGQDGGVSTTTFGERYESELANDYGNLASRTLAMIGRYRDGVVPDVRRRPRAGGRLRRPRRRGLRAARQRGDHPGAGADLAARPAPEPLRRGAGALAARQGRREGGRARHRAALARRGHPHRHGAAPPLHPRDGGEAARRARRARARPRRRGVRRAPRRRQRRQARAAVPQAAVIDSHTHLDSTPGDDADIVAAARAAGVTRILTIGTDAESSRRAPRRRGGARRRLVRHRPPPEQRHRLHATRSPTSCARSPATRAAPRSARPAWTTTATTRRAPTRSAPSPPTSASRASSASRSSSTPAPPTTTRSPRSPATRRAST